MSQKSCTKPPIFPYFVGENCQNLSYSSHILKIKIPIFPIFSFDGSVGSLFLLTFHFKYIPIPLPRVHRHNVATRVTGQYPSSIHTLAVFPLYTFLLQFSHLIYYIEESRPETTNQLTNHDLIIYQ
jgi:hypothetical protein